MRRPLCLDLFSGAGGTAIGLHRAGFDVVHFEWDADACATLRAAFPGDEVHEGDLRQSPWESWAGRVHLLWSSFPCQAWSTAGKRAGALDDRNGWPWTVEAIDRSRPTWVLCENVEGLTMHRGGAGRCGGDPLTCPGCYFDGIILAQLRERFAHVSWRVLDAADYGVPQRRHRVILAAGPAPFPWPMPTHCDPTHLIPIANGSRVPWVSVRTALRLGSEIDSDSDHALVVRNSGHRPPHVETVDGPSPTILAPPKGTYDRLKIASGDAEFLTQLTHDPKHAPVSIDQPAPTLRGGGDGHGAPHYWLRQEMTNNAPVSVDTVSPTVAASAVLYLHEGDDPGKRPRVHEDPSRRMNRNRGFDTVDRAHTHTTLDLFSESPGEEPVESGVPANLPRGGQVLDIDRPASTLRAQGAVDVSGHQGGHSPPSIVLPRSRKVRRVTVAECAVLQGFPANHPFQGTKTAQYRQVGNAVAPPVAEVLGKIVAGLVRP